MRVPISHGNSIHPLPSRQIQLSSSYPLWLGSRVRSAQACQLKPECVGPGPRDKPWDDSGEVAETRIELAWVPRAAAVLAFRNDPSSLFCRAAYLESGATLYPEALWGDGSQPVALVLAPQKKAKHDPRLTPSRARRRRRSRHFARVDHRDCGSSRCADLSADVVPRGPATANTFRRACECRSRRSDARST